MRDWAEIVWWRSEWPLAPAPLAPAPLAPAPLAPAPLALPPRPILKGANGLRDFWCDRCSMRAGPLAPWPLAPWPPGAVWRQPCAAVKS